MAGYFPEIISTQVLLTVFLTVFSIWFVPFYLKRRRLLQFTEKVQGPKGWPLIGNALIFLGTNEATLAGTIINLIETYPNILRIWLGPDVLYIVSKPEYLEKLLNHPSAYRKAKIYRFMEGALGHGILTGPVKTWKKHRRFIEPIFNTKTLNSFTQAINQQCHIFIKLLEQEDGKVESDIGRYAANCATDISTVTLFGVPSLDSQGKFDNLVHGFHNVLQMVFERFMKVWFYLDIVYERTSDHKYCMGFAQKLSKLSIDILESRKKQLEELSKLKELEAPVDDEKHYQSLTDILLEKNKAKEISDSGVMDEMNTLMLTSIDSQSTTISFILTMLAIHPEIQQKVYEEIMDVLGPERDIELEDLSKFDLTERCMKESLRLFPTIPNVARMADEDLDLGDVIIPKGSQIAISFFALHRNPKYWPNPLKYDPDRFLPENSEGRHPYAYLPFSAGQRNCIGWKFGMLVMKMMIVMLLRKYQVFSCYKRVEDIAITTNIVIKYQKRRGLTLKLREHH